MRVIWRSIAVGVIILFASGCAQKGFIQEEATGKCQPPPQLVTSKVDFAMKGDAVNKFVTGEVDLKTDQQVYLLASQAMTDERVADYLDCLAQYRDGWTQEQIVYRQRMRQFMKAQPTPTPEQVMKWQMDNPFPISKQEEGKALPPITVSPATYTTGTGNKEKFLLKVTNNSEKPLFGIHLLMEIESGDLNANLVDIIPKTKSEYFSEMGDKEGSIQVGPEFKVILSKGNCEVPTLEVVTIDNIDPRSTKNFEVSINALQCKQKSNIAFKVYHFSEAPVPMRSGPQGVIMNFRAPP